jgi:hypothetical protein
MMGPKRRLSSSSDSHDGQSSRAVRAKRNKATELPTLDVLAAAVAAVDGDQKLPELTLTHGNVNSNNFGAGSASSSNDGTAGAAADALTTANTLKHGPTVGTEAQDTTTSKVLEHGVAKSVGNSSGEGSASATVQADRPDSAASSNQMSSFLKMVLIGGYASSENHDQSEAQAPGSTDDDGLHPSSPTTNGSSKDAVEEGICCTPGSVDDRDLTTSSLACMLCGTREQSGRTRYCGPCAEFLEESEGDELPDGPLHYLFGSQGQLYLAPLAPRVQVFTACMERKKTYLM